MLGNSACSIALGQTFGPINGREVVFSRRNVVRIHCKAGFYGACFCRAELCRAY